MVLNLAQSPYTYKSAITNQQWVLLLGCFLFGLLPAGLFSILAPPNDQILIATNNPSISYPHQEDIVPSWALSLVAVGCLVPVLTIEWFLNHNKPTQRRVWSCLFFFIEFLVAVSVGLIFMLYLKNGVGRFRPDFLDRCRPDETVLANLSPGEHVEINILCTNPDKHMIQDGQSSYPSGHSSVSFNCATFLSAYIFWNAFIRKSFLNVKKNAKSKSIVHTYYASSRRFFYTNEIK
eukprot:Awhi_evm1s199